VSAETQLGIAGGVDRRGRMLGVVEEKYLWEGRLGGEQDRILRHVAGSVDFSLVIDLDLHFNLPTD